MAKFDKKELMKNIAHIGLVTLTVGSIITSAYNLIDSSHKEAKKYEAIKFKKNVIEEIAINDPNVNSEIENVLNKNWSKFEKGEYSLNELTDKNENVTKQSNVERVIKSKASDENKARYQIFEDYEAETTNAHDEASTKLFVSAGIAAAGIIKLNRDSKKAKKELEKETDIM